MDAESLARLKLHLVPGLGPKTTRAIMERFGTAQQVLRATPSDLESVANIGEKTAAALVEAFTRIQLDEELRLLDEHRARILFQGDPEFPALLGTIDSAPPLLYCIGGLEAADQNAVAIVGSRHCTPYGRRITTRLATELSRAGWTIISGLARGIDGAAHEAALAVGGRTIAVLAGGLAKIYPPEHKSLAAEIASRGALLSEMPMSVAPLPDLFPRRNRIISGLGRAVIVVEAALRSGALITARLAGEQGREVMAVPGQLDSESSDGTHQLIRQGATLVRSAEDVLESLGALSSSSTSSASSTRRMLSTEPPPNLSPVQLQLWNALGNDGAIVDELVLSTSLPIAEINSALLMMELSGQIRRLPGNRFARN